MANAPALDRHLETLDGDILIDCASLTFIDLLGLRALLAAHQRCTARGKRLVLVHPPLCLTRLLELTHLEAVFDVQTEEK